MRSHYNPEAGHLLRQRGLVKSHASFRPAGHGTTPLEVRTKHGVALNVGWPNKLFGVLATLKNGGNALAAIQKTEL